MSLHFFFFFIQFFFFKNKSISKNFDERHFFFYILNYFNDFVSFCFDVVVFILFYFILFFYLNIINFYFNFFSQAYIRITIKNTAEAACDEKFNFSCVFCCVSAFQYIVIFPVDSQLQCEMKSVKPGATFKVNVKEASSKQNETSDFDIYKVNKIQINIYKNELCSSRKIKLAPFPLI